MDKLKAAFDFRGRASRLEFWRYQLLQALGGGLILCLTVPATVIGGWLGAIPFLLLLPLIVACVCVAIRRLHDRNRRAWWLLLFLFGPFALAGLGGTLAASEETFLIALLVSLAGMGLAIWGWVEMGFLRGAKGATHFGPEPSRLG
ncbi:DUF805 domain-containing protein [Caulobacter henricii]|uniref:DUF805 domain-containing protein n=1 Tax=Caulobacter henricii TaxID=69395 RepID=A0A0N7JHY9_9CAUL|nr:DUF805 domain-containing protein [Caulobacter henricii]ALL14722.1 hypothetical protein AQ619_15910 [Caulobacter henricii]